MTTYDVEKIIKNTPDLALREEKLIEAKKICETEMAEGNLNSVKAHLLIVDELRKLSENA